MRKEDFECHEHNMLMHRVTACEEAIRDSEEKDTERKMILHRLETIETSLKESNFAHKSDLRVLEDRISANTDKMIEDVKREVRKYEDDNRIEFKENRKFQLRVMCVLAALSSGSATIIQYLLG